MKSHAFLSCLLLVFLFATHASRAEPPQPISEILRIDHFLNKIHQWIPLPAQFLDTRPSLTTPMVAAAMLCFVAASISSAGGIGGGGLYIPIMTIVTGVDLKVASTFSAFMVTGGSIANVVYYMFVKSHSRRCLIDYDIALLSEPCMLLGVSVGVICNLVFPAWLITMLFAVFLAWSTFKTCTNGVKCWKCESECVRRADHDLAEKLGNDGDGTEANQRTKEPLLGTEEYCSKLGLPWFKLGVLVMIWLSFFFINLLRGRQHGQIIAIEPCGVVYWVLSSLQIPLAIVYTAWILCRKESPKHQTPNQQGIPSKVSSAGQPNKVLFPIMALLAGMLGGVFGIGGGMLISPLLIQVGIAPEITAATCSFMVFFSSTMSAIQYLLLGMEDIETALIFALICFVASLIGLMVVQRAIQEYGRASLIVFSVSTVMALSTVLITSFGAYDVWNDYISGKDMGFKPPC